MTHSGLRNHLQSLSSMHLFTGEEYWGSSEHLPIDITFFIICVGFVDGNERCQCYETDVPAFGYMKYGVRKASPKVTFLYFILLD